MRSNPGQRVSEAVRPTTVAPGVVSPAPWQAAFDRHGLPGLRTTLRSEAQRRA